MPELQAEIEKLCKEYAIELVPVLNRTLQGDNVQVMFVDMNDPKQVEKFGLGGVAGKTSSGLLTN